MEALARDDALAIHDLVVGDVVDVRMARDMRLLLVVWLQLAEHLGGLLEAFGRQVLVANHQHVVVGKRTIQFGARHQDR